jgi:PIN domain nuclease of toxin-antitoxin system
MDFFLDTHSLLWFIAGDIKLSKQAKYVITDLNNRMQVSIASLWEISIKVGKGKLELSHSFDELFPSQLVLNEIEILPIKLKHLSALLQLPLYHNDPFDRIIIAQAIAEKLPVITKDSLFQKYPIELIW